MLTILIPTRNRSRFLARLLHYYAHIGLTYPIRIGDSSDPEICAKNAGVVQSVSERLVIACRPYPGVDNLTCMADLLDQVTTPYVVWSADDDFLVPRALQRAVTVLEARPDISAVHGEAVLFGLAPGQTSGPVLWTSRYRQEAVEDGRAAVRLITFMSAYFPTIYSVHRTETLRWCYQRVIEFGLDSMFGELLPSCVPVIRGRIAKLGSLYMVRQAHASMTSGRLNPDAFDWIARPGWSRQWGHVQSALAREISGVDGMCEADARRIVKEAFWAYLARGLAEPARVRAEAVTSAARWRARLRRVPGLTHRYHKIRRLLPGAEHSLSLSALSHRSSPHFQDFAPIHCAILGMTAAADRSAATA